MLETSDAECGSLRAKCKPPHSCSQEDMPLQPLMLEMAMPSEVTESSTGARLPERIRLQYTTLPNNTTIPALRVEHLSSAELAQRQPVAAKAPHCSPLSFKGLTSGQANLRPGLQWSGAALDVRRQRSHIMHGQVPVLLTLFDQVCDITHLSCAKILAWVAGTCRLDQLRRAARASG